MFTEVGDTCDKCKKQLKVGDRVRLTYEATVIVHISHGPSIEDNEAEISVTHVNCIEDN